MTLMQEQAIDLIKNMPDEKIFYLINLLNGIVEAVPVQGSEPTDAQKAYENLQKFRHRGTTDIDYKAVFFSALEEKYGSVD